MLTPLTTPGYSAYAARTFASYPPIVTAQGYAKSYAPGNVVAFVALWGLSRAAFPVSSNWGFGGGSIVQGGASFPNGSSVAISAGTTITNTGASALSSAFGNADMVLAPGSAIVGFPPGTFTGVEHVDDVFSTTFNAQKIALYNQLAGQVIPAPTIVVADLGGSTLTPGIYKSATGILISSANLTLDGGGDPNAVFLFQAGSTLTVANGRSINLINGAKAKNVFWQVGSSATVGSTAVIPGLIIALTSITLQTGATLNGRAWALNGQVSLDTTAVVIPA
jgi:hypothetical protein